MKKDVDNYRISDSKFEDDLYIRIITTYLDTGSVNKTAETLNTTQVKVRKVLITENLWSSSKSLEIQHYLKLGKSTRDIAEILSTTEKAVQQYLPYTKGLYNSDNPSVAALNSADYRERIRIAKNKVLKQNLEMAIENRWHEMYIHLENTPIESEKCSEHGIHKPNEELFNMVIDDQHEHDEYQSYTDTVRLHLELVRDDLENPDFSECISARNDADDTTKALRKYGNVKYGNTISRDVIVPGDMPLWALHYVIQKCFGWQNSHLHQFELPEERFNVLTKGKTEYYNELVGVVFRSPWMDQNEQFWCDDYEKGSFKTWLKKKYTGPYESLCYGEGIYRCKLDLAEIEDIYRFVEVDHHYGKYGHEYYWNIRPIEWAEYNMKVTRGPVEIKPEHSMEESERILREVYTFSDIPIDAMKWMSESPLNRLLERLCIEDVLVFNDRGIYDEISECEELVESYEDLMDDILKDDIESCLEVDSPDDQPFVSGITDTLYYNYDFGDDWHVKITGSCGAEDLVNAGRITKEELDEAVVSSNKNYRPVCIAQDGLPVLDDVGGIHGFVQFLRGINQKGQNEASEDWSEEFGNFSNREESLAWAKYLGWSKRKVSNKNLL